MCFLSGSSCQSLYLKPRIPKCLLLLISTENAGWSGHICPKFQACVENWEYLGNPFFSPKEQEENVALKGFSKQGESGENFDLNLILIEMRTSRNFWQPWKTVLAELLYCLSVVFQREKKIIPANHFLEFSWFFSNLNSNVVLCRECYYSFECICVWVRIIFYFLWGWKGKTI